MKGSGDACAKPVAFDLESYAAQCVGFCTLAITNQDIALGIYRRQAFAVHSPGPADQETKNRHGEGQEPRDHHNQPSFPLGVVLGQPGNIGLVLGLHRLHAFLQNGQLGRQLHSAWFAHV